MSYNIENFIDLALEEDIRDFKGKIAGGDHTSLACIPDGEKGGAQLLCKSSGIIGGVELAEVICHRVNPKLEVEKFLQDGEPVEPGDVAFKVSGDLKAILRAERVVLNFMQRMSGIATLTSHFVNEVEGTGAKILDTRKTTPGLRYFEKWAVRIGGGHNHRYGLFDMILIKDNHIDFCGGIEKAIRAVKVYREKNKLDIPVEIEARSPEEVKAIVTAGNINRIMFDNFSVPDVKRAVGIVKGKYETEASGGITLETVPSFAKTGVDFISVGALTHSALSLDLSLKAHE